jgi:hypothetical protein
MTVSPSLLSKAVEGPAAHAGGGELADIWCLDLAAVLTEVGIAEVVGHDEDDVGLVRRGNDWFQFIFRKIELTPI